MFAAFNNPTYWLAIAIIGWAFIGNSCICYAQERARPLSEKWLENWWLANVSLIPIVAGVVRHYSGWSEALMAVASGFAAAWVLALAFGSLVQFAWTALGLSFIAIAVVVGLRRMLSVNNLSLLSSAFSCCD